MTYTKRAKKSQRIAKPLLSNYPKPVADKIKMVAESFDIKSATRETVSPDYTFHVGEGHHFYGVTADGSERSFEVVSEHTIGASGLSHSIGSEFQMPAGTYLIRVSYYTKYWMHIWSVVAMIEEVA